MASNKLMRKVFRQWLRHIPGACWNAHKVWCGIQTRCVLSGDMQTELYCCGCCNNVLNCMRPWTNIGFPHKVQKLMFSIFLDGWNVLWCGWFGLPLAIWECLTKLKISQTCAWGAQRITRMAEMGYVKEEDANNMFVGSSTCSASDVRVHLKVWLGCFGCHWKLRVLVNINRTSMCKVKVCKMPWVSAGFLLLPKKVHGTFAYWADCGR